MNQKIKILLVDRNRNVRNFLQRELSGEGYQVVSAGEDQELLHLLQDDYSSYLLILDPDLPIFLTKPELIELIHLHHPDLPIVIHTILTDDCNYREMGGVVGCVEKGEDISYLKRLISELICK